MTAQTISYLKNSEFTLTGAAGRITPQNMQDLCDTLAARTPQYNVMIPEYGAANTGSSHPLSGVTLFQGVNTTGYTLTQWKAIFPAAVGVGTTATCELDWCAIQLAINTASTLGGVVWTPAGAGYRMTNTNSTTDGSGTLSFPATTSFTFTPGVSLRGDFGGSFITWANDLGAGNGAFLCGGRVNGSSGGFFQDIVLIGPGAGSTLGSTSCQMSGIMTNDRRNIFNVVVQGFKYGIDIVGGQCHYADVYLNANYYGMYWNTGNGGNYGNMHLTRVLCDSSLRSAIGVHQAVGISNTTYWDCFLGTSPYGLFKETNSGSPGTTLLTSGCTFYNCQFENIGNALVSDDITGSTPYLSRVVQLYRTRFVDPQFIWSPSTFKITGTTSYSIFDIGTANGISIEGIANPESWYPGTIGIFNVVGNLGWRIDGDLNTLFSNCIGFASSPVPSAVNTCFYGDWDPYGSWLRQMGSAWTGQVIYTGTVPAVGSIVIGTGGNNGAACTGTSTEVPRGVSVYAPGTGNYSVIANQSPYITVTLQSSGMTANLKVYTASGGAGTTSTTSASPIGEALSQISGASWNCRLRGLI